jgi:hypothetical protein
MAWPADWEFSWARPYMRFLHSSFVAVQRLFARRFFSELATTAMRVCGHRQYRDYRSYRKGSHFPPPTTEPET